MESLTDEIEQRSQELIAKVDELGGSVNAIEFITHEIDESAWGYQERYRIGQDIVVGVNAYEEDDIEVPDLLRVDPESEREQLERLARFKAERDQELVERRLEELREIARGSENLLPGDPPGAEGPLLVGRGVRGDAGRLRPVRPALLRATRARDPTARRHPPTKSCWPSTSWPWWSPSASPSPTRSCSPSGPKPSRARCRCCTAIEYSIERWLVNPGLLVVLVAGIYLASDSHQWSAFFVQWGFAAVFVIGALVGSVMIPTAKKAEQAAERDIAAAGDGEVVVRRGVPGARPAPDAGGRHPEPARAADHPVHGRQALSVSPGTARRGARRTVPSSPG